MGWQVRLHFANNILRSPRLSHLIHLILGIVFNKGGNIVSIQMKLFQVKDNKPQQINFLPTMVVKQFQKNGTIRAIEHAFVWCIIYKQCV
jgi:hypothetical protein